MNSISGIDSTDPIGRDGRNSFDYWMHHRNKWPYERRLASWPG